MVDGAGAVYRFPGVHTPDWDPSFLPVWPQVSLTSLDGRLFIPEWRKQSVSPRVAVLEWSMCP